MTNDRLYQLITTLLVKKKHKSTHSFTLFIAFLVTDHSELAIIAPSVAQTRN